MRERMEFVGWIFGDEDVKVYQNFVEGSYRGRMIQVYFLPINHEIINVAHKGSLKGSFYLFRDPWQNRLLGAFNYLGALRFGLGIKDICDILSKLLRTGYSDLGNPSFDEKYKIIGSDISEVRSIIDKNILNDFLNLDIRWSEEFHVRLDRVAYMISWGNVEDILFSSKEGFLKIVDFMVDIAESIEAKCPKKGEINKK